MTNSRFSVVRTAVLTLVIFGLLSSLASAADFPRKTLELKLGGSDLVTTPEHPIRRVSIADPAIADVVVLSPKEMYVFGKKVGYTSMILWAEGKGKTLLDVVVSLDLTALKAKLHELYPDQKIEVYGTETGVVLTGTVSGPEVVEQVLRLTQTYLPKQATGAGSGEEGTGRSRSGITNLLKVGGIQQVMLEVRFAEVNRESSKDWQAALGVAKLGNDFTGAAGVGPVGHVLDAAGLPAILADGSTAFASAPDAVTAFIQNPSSLLLNFAGNSANIFAKIDNVTTALTFLEGEGLARLLAEPRLVTQSGQEASFLAGGEFPIPVAQNEDTVSIDFKEFGVGLIFTPVVLSDGKISLRVAPSVSALTATAPIVIPGIGNTVTVVPSVSTRKLETTVQLYDGQTLALAGLLQDNMTELVKKIPGLGDIPILGALFRSTGYQSNRTDLLVTVTPHLVKPNKEGTLSYPGEYLQPPNRFEFYLEGKLEGRRSPYDPSRFGGHGFAEPSEAPMGGLEGEFGIQPVTAAQ